MDIDNITSIKNAIELLLLMWYRLILVLDLNQELR